ncbi:MAG TPA: hypothetical protein VEQ84_16410 [Vicinamibacteria bacterium]|nr:hypothetical protein [Vicinamibacteria bacterium]
MPIETPAESSRGVISPADHAAGDPDHHLWRNGRLWWIAFTVHLPGWQKERVRLSLHTADVIEARRRRDDLLHRYPEERGCALSLRIGVRAARGARHAAPMRSPVAA